MADPDQFDGARPDITSVEFTAPVDVQSPATPPGLSAARHALRSAEEALAQADEAFDAALDHHVPMSALRKADARLHQATSDHRAAVAALRREGRRTDGDPEASPRPQTRP